jgi:hypothetical protein
MTKKLFREALLDINSSSLNRFLAGEGQDQAGNITYKRAYCFFEQKRLLGGAPKSLSRRKNEIECSGGFPPTKPRPARMFYPTRNGGWTCSFKKPAGYYGPGYDGPGYDMPRF